MGTGSAVVVEAAGTAVAETAAGTVEESQASGEQHRSGSPVAPELDRSRWAAAVPDQSRSAVAACPSFEAACPGSRYTAVVAELDRNLLAGERMGLVAAAVVAAAVAGRTSFHHIVEGQGAGRWARRGTSSSSNTSGSLGIVSS